MFTSVKCWVELCCNCYSYTTFHWESLKVPWVKVTTRLTCSIRCPLKQYQLRCHWYWLYKYYYARVSKNINQKFAKIWWIPLVVTYDTCWITYTICNLLRTWGKCDHIPSTYHDTYIPVVDTYCNISLWFPLMSPTQSDKYHINCTCMKALLINHPYTVTGCI